MRDQKDQGVVSSLIIFGVLIMILLVTCSGCTTVVPVTSKFPDAPGKNAIERCPQLEKLKDDAKLSDVSKTVAINYDTYYGCAIKTDTWIEWYEIQKRIFENASK